MIELRWVPRKVPTRTETVSVLQYRLLLWRVDASGAISVMPVEWGPWVDVPNMPAEPGGEILGLGEK